MRKAISQKVSVGQQPRQSDLEELKSRSARWRAPDSRLCPKPPHHCPLGGVAGWSELYSALLQPVRYPGLLCLIEKGAADKIPLIDPAGGRTDSTDGRVFPYAFPLLFNYYSQASVGINFIAQKEGGFDKLKGKKIVTVYHDSAYGRETQAAVDLLAKKYGFENIQIPVANPGCKTTRSLIGLYQCDYNLARCGLPHPTS